MSSNSVCNHTRDKQIGLSLVRLQTELDSTQSYYHYLSHISFNLLYLYSFPLLVFITNITLHDLHYLFYVLYFIMFCHFALLVRILLFGQNHRLDYLLEYSCYDNGNIQVPSLVCDFANEFVM